jgi:hypothetical protein
MTSINTATSQEPHHIPVIDMRTLCVISVLTLLASPASPEKLVPPQLDHLVPLTPEQNSTYRNILLSKIGVTPFNCGRAMLLPPSEPEASISVYWLTENGKRIYFVTSMSAAKNLWQQTDAIRYPMRAKSVQVDRIDAEIPGRTARLIRDVWLRMLKGPSGPRSVPQRRNEIELDATHAEFSLEIPNSPPLIAELDFSASFPGKKTKQLVDVWNDLYDYCRASASVKPKISAKVESKAVALLAELNRH